MIRLLSLFHLYFPPFQFDVRMPIRCFLIKLISHLEIAVRCFVHNFLNEQLKNIRFDFHFSRHFDKSSENETVANENIQCMFSSNTFHSAAFCILGLNTSFGSCSKTMCKVKHMSDSSYRFHALSIAAMIFVFSYLPQTFLAWYLKMRKFGKKSGVQNDQLIY